MLLTIGSRLMVGSIPDGMEPFNAVSMLFYLLSFSYVLVVILCVVAPLLLARMLLGDFHSKEQRLMQQFSDDWYSVLKKSKHAKLILPPACVTHSNPNLKTHSVQDKGIKSKTKDGPGRRSSFSQKAAEFYLGVLNKMKASYMDKFLDEAELHFDKLPTNTTPLLCFINSRSGGQQGKLVIALLKNLLNPVQVFDLGRTSENPTRVLLKFKDFFPSIRILVAGGDGTVKWILECIETLSVIQRPAVAILPLGTGNDLARVLGWGKGISTSTRELPLVLEQVARASVEMIDRWEVTISKKSGKKWDEKKKLYFNNYFGIGVDAQIVLQFHNARESAPHRFINRYVNKLWYAVMGWNEILGRNCADLSRYVRVHGADGAELSLPYDAEGIILSNIPSYAGGSRLWHDDSDGQEYDGSPSKTQQRAAYPESSQDGVLEAVAVSGSLNLAQIKVGLGQSTKLGQSSRFEFHISRDVPVQLDGEPWKEGGPARIVVRHAGQACMLRRQEVGLDNDLVFEVCDWARRKNLIDAQQRLAILNEFSRRLELRHRVRPEGFGMEIIKDFLNKKK